VSRGGSRPGRHIISWKSTPHGRLFLAILYLLYQKGITGQKKLFDEFNRFVPNLDLFFERIPSDQSVHRRGYKASKGDIQNPNVRKYLPVAQKIITANTPIDRATIIKITEEIEGVTICSEPALVIEETETATTLKGSMYYTYILGDTADKCCVGKARDPYQRFKDIRKGNLSGSLRLEYTIGFASAADCNAFDVKWRQAARPWEFAEDGKHVSERYNFTPETAKNLIEGLLNQLNHRRIADGEMPIAHTGAMQEFNKIRS
jgi:hypothetical protein